MEALTIVFEQNKMFRISWNVVQLPTYNDMEYTPPSVINLADILIGSIFLNYLTTTTDDWLTD